MIMIISIEGIARIELYGDLLETLNKLPSKQAAILARWWFLTIDIKHPPMDTTQHSLLNQLIIKTYK